MIRDVMAHYSSITDSVSAPHIVPPSPSKRLWFKRGHHFLFTYLFMIYLMTPQ
jgi:hypothetical protein